jgi:hypothetical protein
VSVSERDSFLEPEGSELVGGEWAKFFYVWAKLLFSCKKISTGTLIGSTEVGGRQRGAAKTTTPQGINQALPPSIANSQWRTICTASTVVACNPTSRARHRLPCAWGHIALLQVRSALRFVPSSRISRVSEFQTSSKLENMLVSS